MYPKILSGIFAGFVPVALFVAIGRRYLSGLTNVVIADGSGRGTVVDNDR